MASKSSSVKELPRELFKLAEIKESPFNPRRISDKTLDRLVKSISEFGYVDLLVVNKRNMQVVGGNQRLKALKILGYKAVEAVVVDLPLDKEKALNVALNKISGEWDFVKLKEVLVDLPQEDLDLTGFESSELELFLGEQPDPVFDGAGGGDGGDGEQGGNEKGQGEPPLSGAFVVYVSFKDKEAAEAWLAANGIEHNFLPNKRTYIWKQE